MYIGNATGHKKKLKNETHPLKVGSKSTKKFQINFEVNPPKKQ
jgi:hypothetical protein